MGQWILFLLTLPMAIFGWAVILILRLFGAVENLRWEPFLVLTAERTQRVRIFSGWSFTFWRGVVYAPRIRQPVGAPWSRTQEHEHVHVRQAEDGCLYTFALGLFVALFAGDWLAGLLIWSFGDYFRWLLHGVAALLRGERFYRDAENERSAFAQTDRPNEQASWLDLHRLRVKKSAPEKVVIPVPPQQYVPGFLDDEPEEDIFESVSPTGCRGCGTEHCVCELP